MIQEFLPINKNTGCLEIENIGCVMQTAMGLVLIKDTKLIKNEDGETYTIVNSFRTKED